MAAAIHPQTQIMLGNYDFSCCSVLWNILYYTEMQICIMKCLFQSHMRLKLKLCYSLHAYKVMPNNKTHIYAIMMRINV